MKIKFNKKVKCESLSKIKNRNVIIILNIKMCGIFIAYASTVHAHTDHYGWPWSFFDNSFWSSNFYFRQFDPNLRLISSDFLVNGGIGRIGTKIKKGVKHGWCSRSFRKNTLWSSNF
jgi:hypothetical protein